MTETILAAVCLAAAAGLSGLFLALRRMAMMADAISHSILPGLVAAYIFAHGPNLLAGMAGAAAAALLTVFAVERLTRTKSLREDAAIGLVFPSLFSIGVLAVSLWYGGLHIDTDSILYGELAFAPLERFRLGPLDMPQAAAMGVGLLVLNGLFLWLFFKELKSATFDPVQAQLGGLKPKALHYALMAVVACTAVGAFSAVGAVLSTCLLVAPAACAVLLTRKMPAAILLSCLIGPAAAAAGCAAGFWQDVSLSGSIAAALGLIAIACVLFAPERGLLAQSFRQRRVRQEFGASMLAVHLLTHQGSPDEAAESAFAHLVEELGWTASFAAAAVQEALRRGWIESRAGRYQLTPNGVRIAQSLAD